MTDIIQSVSCTKPVWWSAALLLSPVSRALGIPCRVVTNFGSAHDSNANLMIEHLYDENGERLSEGDSIWWVCGGIITGLLHMQTCFPLHPYLPFISTRLNEHSYSYITAATIILLFLISLNVFKELPCLGGQLDDPSRLGAGVWWLANQWPNSTRDQWRWFWVFMQIIKKKVWVSPKWRS